jgi:hypothetical protein
MRMVNLIGRFGMGKKPVGKVLVGTEAILFPAQKMEKKAPLKPVLRVPLLQAASGGTKVFFSAAVTSFAS